MKKVVMNAEFESKKRHVESWLDAVIRTKTMLRNLSDIESNGVDAEICGCSDKTVHIYKGLESIAFYLGKTVTYNPNWDSERERGYMSFEYNDFHIFQLWDKKS